MSYDVRHDRVFYPLYTYLDVTKGVVTPDMPDNYIIYRNSSLSLHQSMRLRRCNEFGMRQVRGKTVAVTDSGEVNNS